MQVQFKAYDLPFKHPFTISKGTKTHQPTLIVSLSHLGRTGVGEAPAISYYNITTERMVKELTIKKQFVEKFAFTEPERYWHYLHHLMPANPFLVCALDIAGWDLYGKMKGKPLGALFQLPVVNPQPLTSFTIGMDTPEQMVAKMQELPWPVYKVKLGTAQDIEIIEALRKHTQSIIRVDANAAWQKDEALDKITALKELGVELVEQPLAKDDWEGMEWLAGRSPLPLVADEACVDEKDVARCKDFFHGINIKLTKCSGITPAIRMMGEARSLGLKVMLGCMNESSIGSAALAHMAPLADWLDADGPLLLQQDVGSGLQYDFGKIISAAEPGLGVQWVGA
ncbi:dipeptide epimerase [Cnuella takakiae]|nr:dipeptide epimerase [Cnuella takakiae]OLY92706.1 dipeptide epimerase [Cnuella takakiae]